jgi:hypothetical protein
MRMLLAFIMGQARFAATQRTESSRLSSSRCTDEAVSFGVKTTASDVHVRYEVDEPRSESRDAAPALLPRRYGDSRGARRRRGFSPCRPVRTRHTGPAHKAVGGVHLRDEIANPRPVGGESETPWHAIAELAQWATYQSTSRCAGAPRRARAHSWKPSYRVIKNTQPQIYNI